jgi:hypothetical protein
MGRLFVVLLLIAVVVLLVGFTRGWFSVATQESEDRSHYQFTVDKKNVREDAGKAREEAKQLGEKTREEAREIGRKIDNAVHSNAKDSSLLLEKTSIEMSPNSKRIVKVTRSGNDLKPLQLGLKPSTGSNLLATGGEFNQGQIEAAITIEAQSNAHDGSITISGYGESLVLNVSIEPALVPATHEPDGAALNGR